MTKHAAGQLVVPKDDVADEETHEFGSKVDLEEETASGELGCVVVFPALVKALNVRDGLFTSRLSYWTVADAGERPRSPIVLDGVAYWGGGLLSYARETGLTYEQVRQSIRRLEHACLIVKRKGLDGGLLITHSPEIERESKLSRSRVFLSTGMIQVCERHLPDALVLANLAYWQRKKRGKFFLKTHRQLRRETGLSKDQTKRALARLDAAGLIQRDRGRGNHSYRPLLHVKVEAELLKNLLYALRRQQATGVQTGGLRCP